MNLHYIWVTLQSELESDAMGSMGLRWLYSFSCDGAMPQTILKVVYHPWKVSSAKIPHLYKMFTLLTPTSDSQTS